MALYTLAPQPWLIFLDNYFPIPNGQLAIYHAGTSTPVVTYADVNGAPHPWPITLDMRGYVPGGLYLQPGLSYKFVLHQPPIDQNLDGAVIRTQDNIGAVPSSSGSHQILSTPGFHPALNVGGVTLLEYDGAGDVAISGLVGGVPGQILIIRNLTPYTITLFGRDGSALAINQLHNFVSGVSLIVGGRGVATYVYSAGAFWGMGGYAQGGQYVQPYDAASYGTVTPGTWTVEPGDLGPETFYLEGRHLFYSFYIHHTSVAGLPYGLTRRLPLAWQSTTTPYAGTMLYTEDGGTSFYEGIVLRLDDTHVTFRRAANAPWATTTNLTGVIGQLAIPLD